MCADQTGEDKLHIHGSVLELSLLDSIRGNPTVSLEPKYAAAPKLSIARAHTNINLQRLET